MPTAKKRSTRLTRDELFATALRIVDAEGLAALSMRRLAAEVGVEAASLYHHVPNKDALIDGMLLQMRQEIELPDPLPTDWKDIYVVIFAEYYRMLASHPNLVAYAARRVETDPETSGLERLVQMGFSENDAVELWQSVIALRASRPSGRRVRRVGRLARRHGQANAARRARRVRTLRRGRSSGRLDR